ncbi:MULTISPECIES: ChaN family lipoprotein [unclassified Lentimicrobium]|uniref:ChaN family lipoprotein n=1 Tax=unclassified Lentimicrobium TaxID=2677434 RepID=UPI001551D316|nr:MULTISPECIES: ChaN family lipoprotein [unclassified Lentimicrobium]NPD47874.1 ChaN family lipoprotein [Lentimicrobium sp. S6]NPD83543.1 ChaN family lipoprotein [Lentimicrobium sp. L6]NPD85968.1 ChaN family lipoprotein [Lentimicrobium sp. L6]
MKRFLLFIIPLVILSIAFKTDKPSYQIFKKDGKTIKYQKMIKSIEDADIVMFGELHNNPICHWLQLELTKDLFDVNGESLVLGAEMFESDNQIIIDEYFADFFAAKKFEADARLWPNYKTDYKPLLEFAKTNNLDFIATNVPRRYASIVHKKGFEALEELPEASKVFLAEIPIVYDAELPAYKEMMEMMKDMGHANENLPKAQAIKDATMAHFILKNLKEGQQFLHYHGTFHSNNFEGIVWYLKQANPNLKIVTIASVEQSEIEKLEEGNLNLADFILAVDEDMTKTH